MEGNYADGFDARDDNLYPNDPSLVTTENLQFVPRLPYTDPNCKITSARNKHHTLWEHSVILIHLMRRYVWYFIAILCDANLCIS